MGKKRKIPARKHHGIRDPLKQIEQKEKKLAHAINNPPTLNIEQHMSYRFKEFKMIADASKRGYKIKLGSVHKEDGPRQKTKINNTSSASKHSSFKQFRNESDEDYLRRINRITNAAVREVQYEAKYGVNVIHNTKTGEIMMQRKQKNEIDKLHSGKQKLRCSSSESQSHKSFMLPLTDTMCKVQNVNHVQNLKEYKYDALKFGEIVHGPPLLTLPRNAIKNETVPRPGRKANLLLNNIVNGSLKSEAKQQSRPSL